MSNVKESVVKQGINLVGFYYSLLKHLPTKRKKVLCISRQENHVSRDFRMLISELKLTDNEINVRMITNRDGGSTWNKVKFAYKIFTSLYHIATSEVCVIDAYWPPISLFTHKKDLTVIQMWHSIGKIKKSGYQTLDTKSGRSSATATLLKMHKNYDYVIAGSSVFNDYYRASFDISDDKILNIGLPRIDYLLQHENAIKTAIYKQYPEFKNSPKPTVLYIPTYRKYALTEPTELLNSNHLKNYNFIVKCHANQKLHLKKDTTTCPEFKAIDLLTIADYVITDYSAVALEAAILNKPTLYYLYDHSTYIENNGLNVNPLDTMPNSCFHNITALFDVIDQGTYDNEELQKYRSTYLPEALGTSTKSLVHLIIQSQNKE